MGAVDVDRARTTTLGRYGERAGAKPRSSVWSQIWRDRLMLLLIAPGVLYFVLFRYLPLLGNIIAFEDFLRFADSPFVGFANFQAMFNDAAFWQALQNTVVITLLQLIFYFPAPICLA